MKRITASLITALAVLLPAQASPALTAVSALNGTAELANGSWLRINTQPAHSVWPYTLGEAWLMDVAQERVQVLQIQLDCLHVTWRASAYPFPPYTPYHVATATGKTADGVRYSITAVDMAPDPLGFGDRLLVTTERGSSTCGAVDELGERITSGDLVIVGDER